jgi:hypothetical protein
MYCENTLYKKGEHKLGGGVKGGVGQIRAGDKEKRKRGYYKGRRIYERKCGGGRGIYVKGTLRTKIHLKLKTDCE